MSGMRRRVVLALERRNRRASLRSWKMAARTAAASVCGIECMPENGVAGGTVVTAAGMLPMYCGAALGRRGHRRRLGMQRCRSARPFVCGVSL